MRLRVKWYLLLTAFLCAATVRGQGGDRIEFTAESTRTEFVDGGVRKWYSGNVFARSEDLSLQAGDAVYESGENLTRLHDAPVLRDSIRTLRADTILYYDRRREALAIGRVRGSERSRSFAAARVRYLRGGRMLFGFGGVTVHDDSIRGTVTGAALTFNDSTRDGWVFGSPAFVREDEKGRIVTITAADTARVIRTARTAELWNNVVVIRDSMIARAERAFYEDIPERVTLFGKPVLEYLMHGTGDDDSTAVLVTSTVSGDTIRIFLREERVTAVEVFGNATGVTVATDSAGGIYYRSVLQSRAMRLDMANDEVTGVTARGGADSYYMHAAAKGREMFVNTARGDTIRFFFTDGQISTMRVEGVSSGQAAGKYFEYKPATADTLAVAGTAVQGKGGKEQRGKKPE